MTIRQQIRWDDGTRAIVDDVLAKGMAPQPALVEIARRLGVPFVSDNQLRNAYARNGRRFSWRAGASAEPRRQVDLTAKAAPAKNSDHDHEPPTHRSERVPTTQPPAPSGRVEVAETACRAFVAPMVREPSKHTGRPGLRKAIIVSDVHVPYEDPVVWGLMLQVARDIRPHTFAINGDFIDCLPLSFYPKDPGRTSRIRDEVDQANVRLDEVDSLGCEELIWNNGNHSARFERYVSEKCPELHGMFSLHEWLKLQERGYMIKPYKQGQRFGSLYLTHDMEHGGIYAVQRTRDEIHADVAIGHIHRAGVAWRADVTGRVFFGASFGWMGSLEAVSYAHRAKVAMTHVHGFGIASMDEETGQTFVEVVPVIGGRCVAGGKLYVAANGAKNQRVAA